MTIAVTATSQATRFESNFSADRDPRTPAESTLPNRATRKIRSAPSARKKRKNGTRRKMICHQFLRQKWALEACNVCTQQELGDEHSPQGPTDHREDNL